MLSIVMASCSITLHLMLYILLFLYIECVRGQEADTFNGPVRGKNLTTRNGRRIKAFLGIPYAKPPVGPLRFRAPVEPKPWSGVLVADTDREQCPQLRDGAVEGNEDCLYLNVYTRKILTRETTEVFPTMVYIHGGQFVRGNGSSTMYGPEYLLDKDIVLVTLNYRLGVLGFLGTNDQYAPGNFGLKDQVLALKWVKKNIAFFCGDRNKVTVFGHDAGGVSAQLHSLSHASAGLINQYVSQSGTSLCLWSYVDDIHAPDDAKRLGKHLNCPTSNTKDLVDCLRKADINSLVDSDDIFGDKTYRFKTWAPTIEPKLSGAFLTRHPYHQVQHGTNAHRSIIGNVADEGLMLTAQYYSDTGAYEEVANNLNAFIQQILNNLYNFRAAEVYVERTKKFYFNGTELSDKEMFTKNMTSLISDTFFLNPADFIARTILGYWNDTIYFYSFDYRGTFSETEWVIGSNENIGVTHGDDIRYFFPRTERSERSESDEEMIDAMIDLWTSFADTGIPNTKRFPDPNFWKHYGDVRDYLKIGNNSDTSLSRQDHFDWEALEFLGYQEVDITIGSYFRNVLGLG